MKQGCIRTTVHIPQKLHDEAKKRKINLSNFFTEMLEYELYHENTEYLEKKLKEENSKHEHKQNLLHAQLKLAKEKKEIKKDKLTKFKPKIRRYGEIIEGDD